MCTSSRRPSLRTFGETRRNGKLNGRPFRTSTSVKGVTTPVNEERASAGMAGRGFGMAKVGRAPSAVPIVIVVFGRRRFHSFRVTYGPRYRSGIAPDPSQG